MRINITKKEQYLIKDASIKVSIENGKKNINYSGTVYDKLKKAERECKALKVHKNHDSSIDIDINEAFVEDFVEILLPTVIKVIKAFNVLKDTFKGIASDLKKAGKPFEEKWSIKRDNKRKEMKQA